jgi:hypothetical protein
MQERNMTSEIIAQTNTSSAEQNYPRQPYNAGFRLVAALPLAVLIMLPLNAWVHRQEVENMIGLPLVFLAVGGTAYLWANALVKRSGYETNWRIGLAGAVAFIFMILGVGFGAFELIFGNLIKLLGITQTVRGTRPEFYVVFVTWTGLVAGGTGLAVGLVLKQPKTALKLLGLGFVTGAVVFFLVAVVMEQIGFVVGTPRPDGLPSMPIVTVLGIWSAALVGSELFGRILARSHKSHYSP